MRTEAVPPRTSGMFYIAVVQAVLLYGSETWNVTPSSLKALEGFHLKAAWRMAIVNKPRRNPIDDSWSYPASADVMEEVGLHSIAHYIEVRRQTIANFIVNRPIFGFCQGRRRRRGSAPRQFDLETARAASTADVAVSDEADEAA